MESLYETLNKARTTVFSMNVCFVVVFVVVVVVVVVRVVVVMVVVVVVRSFRR